MSLLLLFGAPFLISRHGESFDGDASLSIFAGLCSAVAFSLIFCSFFFCLDMFVPGFRRFKHQPHRPPSFSDYKRAYAVGVLNTFFVSIPCSYLYAYHLMPAAAPVDSYAALCLQTFLLMVTQEAMSYVFHRGLHHPLMFRAFHRHHHTFQAPIAISHLYAHPVEHVLNIVPLVAGPVIIQCHPLLTVWWLFFGLYTTCCIHSGYRFPRIPGFPDSSFHELHHRVPTYNFGNGFFADILGGTAAAFARGPAS